MMTSSNALPTLVPKDMDRGQYTQSPHPYKELISKNHGGLTSANRTGSLRTGLLEASMGLCEQILERVESFIRDKRLCRKGDRVLIACSGGGDSTSLLDIMRRLSPRLGISIGVLCVDHGQNSQSKTAMGILQKRCGRWDLPFYSLRVTPDELPPESGETRMRSTRYRIFSEMANQAGYDRVATGHTRTDQVETIFMRILRGTGVSGLTGIPSKRSEFFIRPLIECERDELVSYLRSRRLTWTEDTSNADSRHLRNRVRHEILPAIRKFVNPSVDRALLRLSRAAARDSDLLGKMAASLRPELSGPTMVTFPLATLLNLHDAVLARVILRMLVSICEPGANLEQVHLEQLLAALHDDRLKPCWTVDLPGQVVAGIHDGDFFLRRGRPENTPAFRTVVNGPGEVHFRDSGDRLRFSLQTNWDPEQASADQVFFDASKIDFPLVVRSMAPGDRMKAWRGSGSKKVSRILLDAKIPRHLRSRVPLLVKDDVVLWVAGHRRSDQAPVLDGCKRVLAVRLER